VVDLIVELREKLTATGLDAGPDTTAWHLEHHHGHTVPRATVARRLAAAGLVTPEPKKRPKSSYTRFAAEQPNECWQSDFTHYRLTRPDGRPRGGHRDPVLARRPLPLRPLGHRPSPGHRPDRAR
jgi:transposase InsO family protein